MPKEHIYTAGVSSPFEVQVGWAADRDVQVGVELADVREEIPEYLPLPDRRSLLWQLFGDRENLIRFGVEMAEMMQRSEKFVAVSDEEKDQCAMNLAIEVVEKLHQDWRPTGVWSTLTREDCNRLIKVLRRARDAAYGRDE